MCFLHIGFNSTDMFSTLSYFFPQGRQKLARFSAHEFATLVIDILTDAKRRQWGNSCESPKGTICFRFQFIVLTLNLLC